MYCSLDKIDLTARLEGRLVAIQTDHRTAAEIEDEPELSVLYALARVLNARGHADENGPIVAVHYAVANEPPEELLEALRAAGAVLERMGDRDRRLQPLGPASDAEVAEVADRAFAGLARRAAARIGSRDPAVALRMLEDQTFADPPSREDEPAYWSRVLELAALAGELLRARFPGRWVHSDRALVPFGFQVSSTDGGSTTVFPTNRAQRVVEDGRDESLFKLLLAASETMARPGDAPAGRLMPSLRDRRDVELDEMVWRSLLAETAGADELPVIVFGIDGESTFGMVRRDALGRPADEAMAEALRNLAAEEVRLEELHGEDAVVLVASGSFYAAEKLLDEQFMRGAHDLLGAELLAAAVPARGLLMVTDGGAPLARFAALVRARYDDGGGRAISPAVLLVSDGRVTGFVGEPADRERLRADTSPGTSRRRK